MNILLISQCDKRALTETRRILDQFAERKGDRSWQTPITQAGLETLHRLLRKTARKNTAVACHWLRGRDHAELLWIVGDARRFNAQGATPTNTTQRNVLRAQDENDWLSGEDIRLMAGLAALFHDLGKACQAFQQRLRSDKPQPANLYRHEWVSLRLLQGFVGSDDDAGWLTRLQNPSQMTTAVWESCLQQAGLRDGMDPGAADKQPFQPGALPPLAAAIAWLVLSHHRLPLTNTEPITANQLGTGLQALDHNWNQPCDPVSKTDATPYWYFPYGLPCNDSTWCTRVAKLAGQLAARPSGTIWLDEVYPLHLARLTLMLADHHFSSQTVKQSWQSAQEKKIAFANTLRRDPALPAGTCRRFNQTLPEHLTGVARHALHAAAALPDVARALPALGRCRALLKRSTDPRFSWQNKAHDMASSLRQRAASQGAFIVNLASTGGGKTLGNARIMHALANPDTGMRCAFALGLRTLTLQTGQAFRERLQLSTEQLAIRVGGSASRELFELQAQEAEASGSASSQPLLDEENPVLFDGQPDHPLLQQLSHDPQFNALLAAPVLVCTIDHLTPATEATRGGRQIAPMLRLMSSDLVLDEPDDFSVEDLPALTRLVYWAGLLGSRVLLSSATLPPALVQCLFDAYQAGRHQFQRHRGMPGQALNICCLWVDEQNCHAADCPDSTSFAASHQQFAANRAHWLAGQAVRRNAVLMSLAGIPRQHSEMFEPLASLLRQQSIQLHTHNHDTDPVSGKRVSIGLIRLANISTIYPLAQALYAQDAPDGVQLHLCVYHAQYPLLLRSAIERQLDAALTRHNPQALFTLPDIRHRLDGSSAADHVFIVLSSPVSEVGRDHCYNWAIAEPSSMRSLIQLAGRVRRHWPQPWSEGNLLILQYNLAAWQGKKPAYCRPGFENKDFPLDETDLSILLRAEEYQHPDSRPRLLARPEAEQRPTHSLTDLEHHRLQVDLNQTHTPGLRRNSTGEPRLCAATCWQWPHAMLHAALQRKQPFRLSHGDEWELALLPDEDSASGLSLLRLEQGKQRDPISWLQSNHLLHLIADHTLLCGKGIRPWGSSDYLTELEQLASTLDMPLEDCARRYGRLRLRADKDSDKGWLFHPALGFGRKR
ncbi:CRISPR-associated helicase Cas3, Yersinia-type [Aquitalea magnusonii]|uniref:CRISPR-associated helicase Cas3, Yersinia-type n=1 Tax=Aquitalea magnusonii TaxID=332411 RepID=A0A3G9GCY4_9NEIS|nr:type I-F CRISPR-associated helicase Cas3f [Aquitalea magnusonii]BBF84081.1 CRISPR-associated helicase Cas3, Yersinia-type [Aquitalea magnusonii]